MPLIRIDKIPYLIVLLCCAAVPATAKADLPSDANLAASIRAMGLDMRQLFPQPAEPVTNCDIVDQIGHFQSEMASVSLSVGDKPIRYTEVRGNQTKVFKEPEITIALGLLNPSTCERACSITSAAPSASSSSRANWSIGLLAARLSRIHR